MLNSIESHISIILENIGVALDITEAQYEKVINRYTAVSNHLSKDDSTLNPYKPDIKPQGSFLLGTMVRPIMEDDELDIDLVCRLRGKNINWTQFHVKEAVKDQLVKDGNYKRMLNDEGNRCWTLVYHEEEKFHMDILPSIVSAGAFNLLEKAYRNLKENELEELSIRITDRRLPNYRNETNTINWMKSNPFGYAAWFKEKANLLIQKPILINESIEPVPRLKKDKEPLIRVVQILKRHRDIMFGSNETKPISCIITTLAAYAYNKETELIHALNSVLDNFLNSQFINKRFSPKHGKEIWWINNPTNPEENFADKWLEDSEREKSFFRWHKKAKTDFAMLQYADITTAYRTLKELLGSRAVNEAVRNLGYDKLINENYQPFNYSPSLLNVAHRQQPSWIQRLEYSVEVYGNYRNNQDNYTTISSRTIIPKNCDIYFVAATNVPKPFEVYWQVVNTGEEAMKAGNLRGGIVLAKTAGKGGLNQKEHSAYKGLHWVECFIVKNNICVARSAEFFVNIE